MKRIHTLSILLLSLPAFGQSVNLDPSFGTAGIAITPNTSEINSIAVDPDGFIFSAGYSLESGGTGVYHLTLTKHSASGALVPNFGTNGMVTTLIDYSEFPLDIKLQADGKILVSGSVYLGPTQSGPGDYNSFVARYNPNGQLDSSFAVNGVFRLPYSDSHIASMIILDDGSVLLAGNSYGSGTISKIDPDGVIDSSFGNSGTAYLSDGITWFILWDAIVLTDQTILCVGYDGADLSNSKLAYFKLDLNGDLVSGFGQNGKVVMDLFNTMPETAELLHLVKESPSGDVFIGGQAGGAVILKVNPANGNLDTGFGNNGILNHSYPFADLLIQADGKFLIGGSHPVTDYNAGFSITRLNTDGSFDTSFDGTGTFTVDASPGNDYLQSMALVGTEALFVGGSSPLLGPNSDFMLAKIHIGDNLSVTETDSDAISIYPNPFTDELTFSTSGDPVSNIQLLDASGRTVGTFKSPENNKLVLNHLSSGVYQLSFTSESTGKIVYKKVVKQ